MDDKDKEIEIILHFLLFFIFSQIKPMLISLSKKYPALARLINDIDNYLNKSVKKDDPVPFKSVIVPRGMFKRKLNGGPKTVKGKIIEFVSMLADVPFKIIHVKKKDKNKKDDRISFKDKYKKDKYKRRR